MRDIHKGLPYKDFPKAGSGIASAAVCAVSGLVPTKWCDQGTVSLLYYEGSQPIKECDIHKDKSESGLGLLGQMLGTTLDLPSTQGANSPGIPGLDSSLSIDLLGFDTTPAD
jgi:hypothetical protein